MQITHAVAPEQTSNVVTTADAKARLDSLLSLEGAGLEWIITDACGQPAAKLVVLSHEPIPEGERWAAFGMLKGQIEYHPGWDDPLEEFKLYME